MLETLLNPPPIVTFDSAAAWWQDHLRATRHLERPIDRAIAGAARVDRLGYAFAGGYAAALRAMVPDLPGDTLASFAATEKGGNSPRKIETTLAEGVLNGRKSWVTLGPEGGVVLVVARVPGDGPRPELRVVRVDASAPGVTITPLPHMPIVPEIPHASISFDGVAVAPSDVLPGDGYDRYLKPFRTIEDLHVHAALLAWLLAVGARSGWPRAPRERALAALIGARGLAEMDPSSPVTHVALGGLLAETRGILADLEPCWATAEPELRARWDRDRPLLEVAGAARSRRLERAWERLVGP
jgi:acyl-CoA dehydrogenase